MSILVFGAYYEPENIASPYIAEGIRKGFVDSGYHIKFYIPTPSRGLTREQIKEYRRRRFETKYGGELEIHRYRMFSEKKGTVQRMFRYLCCNLVQLIIGLKEKNVEGIFAASTPPTQGIIIAILKKIKKVPVLYSLQDVFPDSLIQTGIANEKSILFRMGRKMEQFSYRNIDHIVVPSEAIKENLLLKNVPDEKITVIRNWVNENDVKPVAREDNSLFEEFELDKNLFYVVYAGNMGPAQDIESILNVAEKIRNIPDIRFILFGRGTQFEEYLEETKKSDLDNVVFLPLQTYERVSDVYSLGDACIVSCKAGIGKAALPSKTWSIMATERAVLANFDSESDMGKILKETEAGLINESGDIEMFAENILYLYRNIDECRNMGKKGRGFVLKYLNQEYGVQQYVSCMKSVMGERNEQQHT